MATGEFQKSILPPGREVKSLRCPFKIPAIEQRCKIVHERHF